MYYLRARYYDPATGRFISKDPIKGTLTNPSSQNPYQYAYNNPINLGDPSGLHVVNDGSLVSQACYNYNLEGDFEHYHPSKPGYAYQGDYLGNVGNTGNSSGPHLHFEVFNDGSSVDPQPYFDSGTLTYPITDSYTQTSSHNVDGHQGVDYAINRNNWSNEVNTHVYSAADGNIESGSDPAGYGNNIKQSTEDPSLKIIYGHLK